MQLFWQRGYDASTLPELQAAMGNISPPSFYAAFGSKEKVFAEAVDLYRNEVACGAVAAIEGGATAKASIEGLMRESLKMFTDSPEHPGCMFLLGAVNSTNAAAEEMLREKRREALDMMRKRIRRGIKDGDVPKTADVDGIAAFYTAVLHGIAFSARDRVPAPVLTRVVDSAIGAWDGLVSTRVSRGRAAKPAPSTTAKRSK